MGLLRFVALALLIVLGVRLVVRWLFPWIARYFINKTQENLHEQMKQRDMGRKVYESGEVEIRKGNKGQNNRDDDDSEYVDFEEVKD